MAWIGDEDLLRAAYEKRLPLHERAARTFAAVVTDSLLFIGLDAITVTHRVKGYTSFRKKLDVRGYEDPFSEIPDLIGVRVILLRTEEVKRAVGVLSVDFDVISSEPKGAEPGSDYRSHHLDLRVKEAWTLVPTYRRLNGLRFEVQVRTALMHAWAEIEHAVYKPDKLLPDGLKEEFGELSQTLRECDDTLDRLASQLK